MEADEAVRPMMRALTLAAALSTVAACASSGPARSKAPVKPAAAQPAQIAAAPAVPVVPPEVTEGAKLYRKKGCVMCHGKDAKGGVPNRYSLGKFVPALDKVGQGYTEDELKKKIRTGVASVAKADPNGPVPILVMPPWKEVLSDNDLNRIVTYLMSLAPKESGDDDW